MCSLILMIVWTIFNKLKIFTWNQNSTWFKTFEKCLNTELFPHFTRFLSHFQVLFKNRTIQQSDNLKTGLAPYSDPLCRFIESLPRFFIKIFSAKFFAGFLFAVSRRHSTHSRRQLWDDRQTRFGNRQKTYPVS